MGRGALEADAGVPTYRRDSARRESAALSARSAVQRVPRASAFVIRPASERTIQMATTGSCGPTSGSCGRRSPAYPEASIARTTPAAPSRSSRSAHPAASARRRRSARPSIDPPQADAIVSSATTVARQGFARIRFMSE